MSITKKIDNNEEAKNFATFEMRDSNKIEFYQYRETTHIAVFKINDVTGVLFVETNVLCHTICLHIISTHERLFKISRRKNKNNIIYDNISE